MRPIPHRLVRSVLVGSMIMMWTAGDDRIVALSQQRTPVTLTRIYTGPDGQTHAEQIDVALAPNLLYGREQSETVKAASSYFVRSPSGLVQDWHPANARRYVITLSGRGEVELGGGQRIPLEPGRVLLAEDLTGKGHITRNVGNADWTALFVQLDQ